MPSSTGAAVPDTAAPRARGDTAAPRPRGVVAGTRRALLSGVDEASVMGMELVSAILTWTGVGYLADRWLGTTPWLLVIGALLGNFAGLYLIWLRGARMDAAEERRGAAAAAARAEATRVRGEEQRRAQEPAPNAEAGRG